MTATVEFIFTLIAYRKTSELTAATLVAWQKSFKKTYNNNGLFTDNDHAYDNMTESQQQ